MSRHVNPPFPTKPFGLLLVEGGDEVKLCAAVAGATLWADLVCWKAEGRDHLPRLATLATLDPSFSHARSVGVLLDMEEDPVRADALAQQTLAALGNTTPPVHAALSGAPRKSGVFLAPDGQRLGSIESLCRQAVRNTALATCVDALVACAGNPHPNVARSDKGWLNAYLAMLPEPVRFYESLQNAQGVDPAHAVFNPLRAFLRGL